MVSLAVALWGWGGEKGNAGANTVNMRVPKYVLPIVAVSLLAVVVLTTAVSAMGVPESGAPQAGRHPPPVAPVPSGSGLTDTGGLTPKTPASPLETGGVSQGEPLPQTGPDQKVPKYWRRRGPPRAGGDRGTGPAGNRDTGEGGNEGFRGIGSATAQCTGVQVGPIRRR